MPIVENWKPNAILSVEKVYGSSTSPILVDTDAGKGVLKLPAGCGGTERLVCEFVGSSLARWIDVPIPDFALIRVDADFVTMMCGIDEDLAEEADGFISKYEKAFPLTPSSLQDVKNKDVFTRLVFLDTWIRNEDRYFKRTGKSSSRNTDNVFLVENGQTKKPYNVKAIDHSEAFRDLSPEFEPGKHFGERAIRAPAVFGRFPEFDPHLDKDVAYQVADRLARIEVSEVQALFDWIPRSWKLNAKTRKAFVSFIVKRAAFVAETLPPKLFPTKSTLFDHAE